MAKEDARGYSSPGLKNGGVLISRWNFEGHLAGLQHFSVWSWLLQLKPQLWFWVNSVSKTNMNCDPDIFGNNPMHAEMILLHFCTNKNSHGSSVAHVFYDKRKTSSAQMTGFYQIQNALPAFLLHLFADSKKEYMSHKVKLLINALDLLNVLFNNMRFVFPFNVQIKCT